MKQATYWTPGIISVQQEAKRTEKSQQFFYDMARKFGISDRVVFRGFVNPDSIADEFLDGSSALLLPLGNNIESRYFTSPMKLFEYMATKIPVVVADHPSVNMITGKDTVFLSDPEPNAFAKTREAAVHSRFKTGRIKKYERNSQPLFIH